MKTLFTFKKYLGLLLVGLLAMSLLNGCASNPLGIGYEHSVCEGSTADGVCGTPEAIYKYRDLIKSVRADYLSSGLNQKLYFSVKDNGMVMVKSSRDGKWRPYLSSKWYNKIQNRLKKNVEVSPIQNNYKMGMVGGIPITSNTDLSIQYSKQGSIVATRTNVGDILRDNGEVRRLWIAPVEDNHGDLISAHEVYLVIKQPKWIVGEKTPVMQKSRMRALITPMSDKMLSHRKDYYNTVEKAGKPVAIKKPSLHKEIRPYDVVINDFIK
jgi:type IV conjugative transfer system lipoprotein TraV